MHALGIGKSHLLRVCPSENHWLGHPAAIPEGASGQLLLGVGHSLEPAEAAVHLQRVGHGLGPRRAQGVSPQAANKGAVRKDSPGRPQTGGGREVTAASEPRDRSGTSPCKGRSGAEPRARLRRPRDQWHSPGHSVAPRSTYSRICRLLLTIKASAKAWAPAAPTEATCRLQGNGDPSALAPRWPWCVN